MSKHRGGCSFCWLEHLNRKGSGQSWENSRAQQKTDRKEEINTQTAKEEWLWFLTTDKEVNDRPERNTGHARCARAQHGYSGSTHGPSAPHVCTGEPLNLHAHSCTTVHVEDPERAEKGDTHRHHQLEGLLVHPHGRLVLLHHGDSSGFTSNLHTNTHTRQRKTSEIRVSCDSIVTVAVPSF